MQIYCDMDGVLADFDAHYLRIFGYVPTRPGGTDWKAVRAHPGFYATIPPMPGLSALWNRLSPHGPIVLTGLPSWPHAEAEKREWINRHLPPRTHVICCRAADKHQFCRPGDLLIDDYPRHKQRWLDAGGVWITHVSAQSTCAQLTALGII